MRYKAGQRVIYDDGKEKNEVLILHVEEKYNSYVARFPTGNIHILGPDIDHEATEKLMNQNKKQSKFQEAVERIQENTKRLGAGLEFGKGEKNTVDRYIFTIGNNLTTAVVYGSSYTREGSLLTISSSQGDSIFDLDHYKSMTSRLNPDYVEEDKYIEIEFSERMENQILAVFLNGKKMNVKNKEWRRNSFDGTKIVNIKVS